jgi:hypothetical protein
MALTGVSQTTETTAYQNYAPASASSSTTYPDTALAANASANAGTAVPLAKVDAATVDAAVDTAGMSSVVANLGANFSGTQLYTATGLLNSMSQAGQAPTAQATPAAGTDIPAYEQDLTDFAVVSTLPVASDTSGIYTPRGSLEGLPTSAANDGGSGQLINTVG